VINNEIQKTTVTLEIKKTVSSWKRITPKKQRQRITRRDSALMPCFKPIRIRRTLKEPLGVIVPCGSCDHCLLSRTQDWATRCELEAKNHYHNLFVTLTYTDENLTWGYTAPTLVPRDLQLFIKRLRKRYGQGIKYFACGEYGDKYYRPHYHAALFGIDFKDKKQEGSRNGNDYYNSLTLNSIWGLGHCIIGNLTSVSAAYIARYIIDKKSKQWYYDKHGVEPQFLRVSTRPAIAKEYVKKNLDEIYKHDNLITNGNQIKKVPRYFDKQLEKLNPLKHQEIKLDRQYSTKDTYFTQQELNTKATIKKSQKSLLKRFLD